MHLPICKCFFTEISAIRTTEREKVEITLEIREIKVITELKFERDFKLDFMVKDYRRKKIFFLFSKEEVCK